MTWKSNRFTSDSYSFQFPVGKSHLDDNDISALCSPRTKFQFPVGKSHLDDQDWLEVNISRPVCFSSP